MWWIIALILLVLMPIFWVWYKYAVKRNCTSTMKLEGQTVIITGGNRGIGLATSLDLAKRGAKLILACRNMEAANEAVRKIVEQTGNESVYAMKLDLMSFNSIREFVNQFLKREDKLNVLINNAAIFGPSTLQLTEDGNECQFQTNYLGPFLLTNLLLPILRESAPSRIVNVSSDAYMFTRVIDFDNLNSEKSYNYFRNYCRTKLCLILFTKHLSKLLEETHVTVNSLHPGIIDTQLMKSSGMRFLFKIIPFILKSEEQGAQTTIFAAVDPSMAEVSGKYLDNCRVVSTLCTANSSKTAEKLWDASVRLCNLN